MAAADAETALWDKACAIKYKGEHQSGDMCGHPFSLDDSMEVSGMGSLGKPALGRKAEWWKLANERGRIVMGHHL